MVRVERKPFRLVCPDFADVFVGRETTQGLQPVTVVVCVDEVVEVRGYGIVACKA